MFIGRKNAYLYEYSKKHYKCNNKFVNFFLSVSPIAEIALNGKFEQVGLNIWRKQCGTQWMQ